MVNTFGVYMNYQFRNTELTISQYELNTFHVKFKFPTTLSGFRKGVNPVISLFEKYQEFILDKSSNRKDWILEVMNDQFINEILIAISSDLEILEHYEIIDHNQWYLYHRLQSIYHALDNQLVTSSE